MRLPYYSARLNPQLFKLNKACASINGPVNLARAMLCIVDAVVDKIKAVQKDAADPAKLMVSASHTRPGHANSTPSHLITRLE